MKMEDMTCYQKILICKSETFAGEKYLEAADIILAAHRRLENQLQEIREENSGGTGRPGPPGCCAPL